MYGEVIGGADGVWVYGCVVGADGVWVYGEVSGGARVATRTHTRTHTHTHLPTQAQARTNGLGLAAMASSWEAPPPVWADDDAVGLDDLSDGGGGEATADEAGAQLAEHLLDLCDKGLMRAKTVCIIAYWSSKAGAVGDVATLAFAPGKASDGACQRHLDAVTRFKDELRGVTYDLPLPGHDKFDLSRATHDCLTIPPHEALADEVIEQPGVSAELARMAEESELPPSYFRHPVVLRTAFDPLPKYPLSLYMDGVVVTKAEAVINVTVQNLASGRRHLLAAVRRSRLCRCGCTGWCTLYPLMSWLRWSFEAMAHGRYPAGRHDGAAWRESDHQRECLAGGSLGFIGALVQIRGDWAGYAHSFGLPT